MQSPELKSFGMSDEKIVEYAVKVFNPEDTLLAEIRARAKAAGLPPIHVGAMDGLHLEVLLRAAGARKVVELGTLAGYSAVCITRAIGPEGKLFTFELEERFAKVARETFAKAGVENLIELNVGPALENFSKIEKHGPFDAVFIDADKENYPRYLEWCAKNLRKGGLVIADNTFAWGHIADTEFSNPRIRPPVEALRAFNEAVARDGRFRATILPTGEGLTLGVKL